MIRRESRWPQMGILLLVFELFASIGLGRIPPVTLASIGLQIGLFLKVLGPYIGSWTLWPSSTLCLNARVVMEHDQFYRIFTAPLFHGSDMHLYYNMVSFAWKGIHLERRHGSLGFILLLLMLTGLTGFIYVGLSLIAAQYFHDESFMNQCAVGFSGVIFALKVLANDSDGNFGFFSVPRQFSIWAELAIIQILVPNASFIGHLSGIIAGIAVAHLIPAFFFLTVQAPWNFMNQAPATLFIGGILAALHMGWVKRPWKTKAFWSSGTPLVCLSSNNVFSKKEYYRLLSGPLEHAGELHLMICAISILLKLYQLEKNHGFFKTISMFMASILVTGFMYIIVQTFANIHECVQGLSGPSFALKTLTLLSGTLNYPLFFFELTELLMLLEPRTFLFHICGLVSGFLIWHIYIKPDPFPGPGIRLGNYADRPSTRSWGYAHYTDAQFRRVVEVDPNEANRSRSSLASSTFSQSLSRERSQRSATPSPSVGPRPRCPPPPDGSCPPPPSMLSQGVVFRESQSPLSEEDINGQVDIEL